MKISWRNLVWAIVLWLYIVALLTLLFLSFARAHDWYPWNCCSGFDCRPIEPSDVALTPEGFLVKESGEVIPYSDERVRKTPPEGNAKYHRCSRGGTAEGATICLYIPNWGS